MHNNRNGESMIKREDISKRILNYLQRNPEAGDTLEGIVNWWLEMERIDFSMNEVEEVLQSLIQKGRIKMYKSRDGATFYRINKKD